MSEKDVTASPEEQDEAKPDSVFDFLYHDSRRIGSFLSQFDNSGLLTGIRQGEIASRSARRGWKVGVGAELPLLAGAKLDVERQPGEGGSESFERSYDPFWTNALTFLDMLAERRLIQPQIEEAALGQFILVKGWLSVLDLAMFKNAWSLRSIQAAIKAGQTVPEAMGNRQQRRGQGKQPQRAQMPNEADLMLELMTVLPHTVHASIMTDHETIWANLREEFMVTPSSELVLTHGTSMPGEWAMLGILNGRPDHGNIEHQQRLAEMRSNLPPGLMNSAIGLMAQTLAPIIRTALGRPTSAYAVTPILIFREVM